MESNTCPACGRGMLVEDLNVKEGVGLCRGCGKLSRLAEIAAQPAVDERVLSAAPPAGCEYVEGAGPEGGAVVRASLRSVGGALGLLAVCLFWNGIVSVFVLLAIAGLYSNLVGPVPAWFPAPPFEGEGKVNKAMSLGMALFLCVFLIPFVLIGSAMVAGVVLSLAGRIEVEVGRTVGRIRTGVGPLRWTKRFDPSAVRRVAEGETSWENEGRPKRLIAIETADRTVKFGSMLEDRRRAWVIAVLHVLLVRREKGTRLRAGPGR